MDNRHCRQFAVLILQMKALSWNDKCPYYRGEGEVSTHE
jgi:hypothetical protein